MVLYFPYGCSYTIKSGPKFESSGETLKFYVSFEAYSICNVTIATSGLFDPKTMGVYVSSGAKNPLLERKEWYGIDVWILNMEVPAGKAVTVIFNGQRGTYVPPQLAGYGYLANKLGLELVELLGKNYYNEYDILLAPFFLTAAPLIHIMIMSMMTYGIASLISGGVKRLSVKLW